MLGGGVCVCVCLVVPVCYISVCCVRVAECVVTLWVVVRVPGTCVMCLLCVPVCCVYVCVGGLCVG